MDLDQWLAAQQDGKKLEPGTFTRNPNHSEAFISKFVPDPYYYIVKIIQGLVASDSTAIDIKVSKRQILLEAFDCQYEDSDFSEIRAHAFQHNAHPKLKQLSLGLNILAYLEPTHASLHYKNWRVDLDASGHFVTERMDQEETCLRLEIGPLRSTTVRANLPNWFSRLFHHPHPELLVTGRSRPESELIGNLSHFCPIPIWSNGEIQNRSYRRYMHYKLGTDFDEEMILHTYRPGACWEPEEFERYFLSDVPVFNRLRARVPIHPKYWLDQWFESGLPNALRWWNGLPLDSANRAWVQGRLEDGQSFRLLSDGELSTDCWEVNPKFQMFGAPSLGVRAFALKRKNRGPFEDQLTLVQDGMIIQALQPFPELKEFDFVLDVGDLKTDITTLQVIQDDKFRKVLQGLKHLVTVSPKELQGPERNYELPPPESPS